MNSNSSLEALSGLGIDANLLSQLQGQYPNGSGGIDLSLLGGALQSGTSASIAGSKIGMATLDNADIVNAISGGQVNFDGLNAIIEQRAGSTGIELQTADDPVRLTRNAKDNIVIGGEAIEGTNYQQFRDSFATSSPSAQNSFASTIASTPSSDIASLFTPGSNLEPTQELY